MEAKTSNVSLDTDESSDENNELDDDEKLTGVARGVVLHYTRSLHTRLTHCGRCCGCCVNKCLN